MPEQKELEVNVRLLRKESVKPISVVTATASSATFVSMGLSVPQISLTSPVAPATSEAQPGLRKRG